MVFGGNFDIDFSCFDIESEIVSIALYLGWGNVISGISRGRRFT